ncbi:MAG: hypothetical protein AAFP19_01175 [Bacteroidota bacterium]
MSNYDFLFQQSQPLNIDKLSKEVLEGYKVKTCPGPEDIALHKREGKSDRLIISWAQRRGKAKKGGFQYYDFDTKEVGDYIIQGYQEKKDQGKKVEPHGICLVQREGQDYLYAISHEGKGKEHIHCFRIEDDQLYWIEDVARHWPKKPFFQANDLFVTTNGDVYFSNPNISPHKFWRPEYVGWIGPNGKTAVLLKKQKYPNGIAIIEDQLYYADDKGLRITALLSSNEVQKNTRRIASFTLGDNISILDEEYLLIASHPSKWKFVKYYLNKKKRSPSAVQIIKRGEPHQHQTIFYSSGRAIGASATAIIHNDHLYISQVFENFLLRLPLSLWREGK